MRELYQIMTLALGLFVLSDFRSNRMRVNDILNYRKEHERDGKDLASQIKR